MLIFSVPSWPKPQHVSSLKCCAHCLNLITFKLSSNLKKLSPCNLGHCMHLRDIHLLHPLSVSVILKESSWGLCVPAVTVPGQHWADGQTSGTKRWDTFCYLCETGRKTGPCINNIQTVLFMINDIKGPLDTPAYVRKLFFHDWSPYGRHNSHGSLPWRLAASSI